MTDRDFDEWIERALDGELPEAERDAVRARMASDAALAARVAAHRELEGYLAGARSVDPPPGFLQDVMAQIPAGTRIRPGGRLVPERRAWWRDWFTPSLVPRYAAMLLVGAVLGSAVFWTASRLGWDPAGRDEARATMGGGTGRASETATLALAADGVRGEARVSLSPSDVLVVVSASATRPVRVEIACEGRSPLGVTRSGEATDLRIDTNVVAWRQTGENRVTARFERRAGLPAACIVSLDGTPRRLPVLR